MKFKLLLPALAEASVLKKRGVKYFRFPPLGLAALAAYLGSDDEIDLQDEHVERLKIDDHPDVVVIQVYVSSANRSYHLADHYRARGAHVCLGGLHVTSLPREAAAHADTVFLGPGEDTWPRFLADFRAGRPRRVYRSTTRCLVDAPPPRRDLIKKHLYLVPNTLVVSRGCPHHCDFCYKDAFYRGGASYYTMAVDQALKEVSRLSGRHLCFLDDNLFGDPRFATGLFEGMRGMGRVWLAAATVRTVLERPDLVRLAAEAGMRSLFIGFETLNQDSLRSVGKMHNVHRDYDAAIKRLHDLGVMVNASFVFGMDGDDPGTFDRTLEWGIRQGLESATFHILTPYPGTPLFERMEQDGRLLTRDWDLYDTRHAVFRPAKMTPDQLEVGFHYANREFGSWSNIWRSAATKDNLPDRVRHLFFSSGLRRFKNLWACAIRLQGINRLVPLMEQVLSSFGHRNTAPGRPVVKSMSQPVVDYPRFLSDVDLPDCATFEHSASGHAGGRTP
jgi:radical SAM superfamily enzyme YgiQ (UPF0313 family)